MFVEWQGSNTPWRLFVTEREDTEAAWGRQGWIEGEGDSWTTYSHDRPNVTADGLTMIFSSNQPIDNSAGWGLWESTRTDKDSPWSEPQSLGVLNESDRSERAADLSSDELTLYVGDGFDGFGPVWMSTRLTTDDEWQELLPVPGMDCLLYTSDAADE